MDDQLGVLERGPDRVAVGDVRDPRLDAGGAQLGLVLGEDLDAHHLGALGGQRAADRRADEAVGARDGDPAAMELDLLGVGHAGRGYSDPGWRAHILAAPCCNPLQSAQPARDPVGAGRPGRRRGGAGGGVRGAAGPQGAQDPAGGDHRRGGRRARWRWRCCAPGPGPATPPSTRCRCGHSCNAKDLPHDDPEALRSRLRIDYPIQRRPRDRRRRAAQRAPAEARSRGSGAATRSTARSRGSTGCGSSSPTARCSGSSPSIPSASPRRRARCRRVFDLGCVVYAAVPTAPPWWAAENGYADPRVRRIMRRGRRGAMGPLVGAPLRLPRRQPLGGDAVAALRRLADGGDPADRGRARRGRVGWAYAGALGFALVYLGEHYVIDLVAGAALVAAGAQGRAAGGAGRRSREPGHCSAWRRSRTIRRVCDDWRREGGALQTDEERKKGRSPAKHDASRARVEQRVDEAEPNFFAEPQADHADRSSRSCC